MPYSEDNPPPWNEGADSFAPQASPDITAADITSGRWGNNGGLAGSIRRSATDIANMVPGQYTDVKDALTGGSPLSRVQDLADAALAPAKTVAGLGGIDTVLGQNISGPVFNSFLDHQGQVDTDPWEAIKNTVHASILANPVARIARGGLDSYGDQGAQDFARFQQSHAPEGLKVAANFATPGAFLGGGEVAGTRSVLGGLAGAGMAGQIADNQDVPEWARGPLAIGGAVVGGAIAHNPEGAYNLLKKVPGVKQGFGSVIEDVSGGVPPVDGGAGAVSSPAPPARTLPEQGFSKADEAIRIKMETTGNHGFVDALPGKLQTAVRQVGQVADPSYTLDPLVSKVKSAAVAEERTLARQYQDATRPALRDLQKAWSESGVKYIGPEDNPIKGTLADRAGSPSFYTADTPELAAAWQRFDDAIAQGTLDARTGYGADTKILDHPEIPGWHYIPQAATRDSIENKVAGISAQYGSSGKERAYTSLYDRIKAAEARGQKFTPEIDMAQLVEDHSNWAARQASNSLFKRGVGGLTKADALAQTHPDLFAGRDAAMKEVASLQGRLATAGKRSAMAQNAADEMRTALEDVQNVAAFPDEVERIAGLETALRSGSRRIDTLMSRGELRAGEAEAMRAELKSAQAKLATFRNGWKTAEPTGLSFDRTTNLYYPPDVAKSIERVSRRQYPGLAGVTRVGDEWRAAHLNWDVSPATIQGSMAVVFDPVNFAKTTAKMAKAGKVNLLAEEAANPATADRVIAFERTMGQAIRGGQEAELSAVNAGSGRTLISRIPWIGNKMAAVENGMFGVVQNYTYQAWKAHSDWLMKVNPGMTREVADAEAAAAAGRWVPHLNMENRGIAPGTPKAAFDRAVFTSTSFASSPALLAKDIASGVTKMGVAYAHPSVIFNDAKVALSKFGLAKTGDPAAAFRTLTGREQLALRTGLRASTAAGTAVALSAAITAKERGDSLDEIASAVQEALFDSSSRKYWALQVPGTDRAVPLPGPIRSFAKLIMPSKQNDYIPFSANDPSAWLQWGGTRLSPAASTGLNVAGALKGHEITDWKGQKILEGDTAEKIARGTAYVAEQIAPTSVSAISEGTRTGLSPADTAESAATQFLGSNVSQASPSEQLNDIAKGMGAESFKDLPTKTQQMLKETHPDLWAEYQSRLSDATKQYYATRDVKIEEQRQSDSLLQSGKLAPTKWADDYHDRQTFLAGAGDALFHDGVQKPRNAHERYLQQIDQSKGTDGKPDWDTIDTWLANQSPADQQYIADHASLPWTPAVAEYRDAAAQRAKMYDIPQYIGYSAPDGQAVNDVLATINKQLPPKAPVSSKLAVFAQIAHTLTPSQQQAAVAAIYGTLKTSPARAEYKKNHPAISRWFDRGALVP